MEGFTAVRAQRVLTPYHPYGSEKILKIYNLIPVPHIKHQSERNHICDD